MAGMLGTVVAQFKRLRLKCRQALADGVFQVGAVQAGRVLRNGLTETLAYTPSV